MSNSDDVDNRERTNFHQRTINNRWWEGYVVRYLVGTVVGGAVLFTLNTTPADTPFYNQILPGITNATKLNAQLLIVLAVFGFAFSYIASAPILVLHAGRGALINNPITVRTSKTSTCIAALLIVLIYMTPPFALHIVEPYHSMYGLFSDSFFYSSFILLLLIQLYTLTYSISSKSERIFQYYKELTYFRSKENSQFQEYTESYRHLREHGNAFFIVLMEFFLGVILSLSSNMAMAVAVVILWLLPTLAVWLIGTNLEWRIRELQPSRRDANGEDD